MYPRNAVSPQRVSLGSVVQVSDGTIQSSGVSIVVIPQGGSSSTGVGTTSYDNGIVLYTPTQAETNCESFVVIAHKAGCIPISTTIVTTASSTAGYAGLAWDAINEPATTVSLANTTIGNVTLVNGLATNTITAAALSADFTTEIQTGLATQVSVDIIDNFLDTEISTLISEIAKIPKSDSTVSWNSTALAAINTQVTNALNTYDVPTNAEMELRTPTPAQLAYIVANSATGVPVTFTTLGGSTTRAVLNFVDGASASTTDNQYNGRLLVFTNGNLKDVVTDITDYVGSTTTATITEIPEAPTSSHNARLI